MDRDEMETAKPVHTESGHRQTSAAFRKAARWLQNRLQGAESKETQKRAGIGEDALRILRERYHIEES